MNRPIFRAVVVALVFAVALTGCDRPADPPGQAAQNKKEDEGNLWRGLLHKLDAAPTDDSKIKVLEEFIKEHPEHPDAAEAKRRLADLQNSPDATAKKVVEEARQKGLGEGDVQSLVALFASDFARQARDNMQRDDLSKPLAVPTVDGAVEIPKSIFVHPTVARGFAQRTLMKLAPDKLEERCDRACLNATLGGLVKGVVGGPLWVEDGKLSPDAVGPLLEKAWVDPDADLLGVPARSWYAIYRPTFVAFVKVEQAMSGTDAEAKAAELATLTDRGATSALYTSYAEKAELAKKTELPAADARSIAGWWLRRHADGTAKLFSAFTMKVIEGYDPELTPAK